MGHGQSRCSHLKPPPSTSTKQPSLLLVSLSSRNIGLQTSIHAVSRDADGHGRTCCPGQIAQKNQVGIRPDSVPDQGGAAEQKNVDDELERVLVLSSVCEGRHTAAEHQAGKQHETRGWAKDEAASGLVAIAMLRCLAISRLAEIYHLASFGTYSIVTQWYFILHGVYPSDHAAKGTDGDLENLG